MLMESIATFEDSKPNAMAPRDEETFVLKNRATRKHESRYNRDCLPLRVLACEWSEQGKGGGIVALLLPRTDRETNRLKKIRAVCFVEKVTSRRSYHEKRKCALTDEVWLELLDLYAEAGGVVDAKFVAKHFAQWVFRERENKKSSLNEILRKRRLCDLLADTFFDKEGNEKRRGSERWWQNQIAAKRKALLQAMYS